MATTRTERLTRAVQKDLERHFASRPAGLENGLTNLLRLLLTAKVPQKLAGLTGEIRGLRSHLQQLQTHISRDYRIPKAVCARYEYKRSAAHVRRRYRVKDSEWRFLHSFASETGWPLDILVPLLDLQLYDWHDELEKDFVNLELMLYEEALNDMLVCGLEGYLSPRTSRRKGYEVYGLNLGMTRETYCETRARGLQTTRYAAVMRSQPQLSAEGHYGGVQPNERSLQAILDATSALFPQYQAVGDFHSHCYDNFTEMNERDGWMYSKADEESNVITFKEMLVAGHRPYVSFILGIVKSPRRIRTGRFRNRSNTMQLHIGGCRIVLTAFRVLGSGRYTTDNVRLAVAGMLQ